MNLSWFHKSFEVALRLTGFTKGHWVFADALVLVSRSSQMDDLVKNQEELMISQTHLHRLNRKIVLGQNFIFN